MITLGALQRAFRLKWGDHIGTCFTLDIDGKQYIVTARHVVEGIKPDDNVGLLFKREWHGVPVKLVAECSGVVDITVLAASYQITPADPFPASDTDFILGQDVYFLGFPFGLVGAEAGEVNRHFPVPFIKKAILSSVINEVGGARILYLDGHNNPGFSGGPVVYSVQPGNLFHVAGVVSGYQFDPQPIYKGESETTLMARHNTGIVISYGISHAVKAIRRNPIGASISMSKPQ